MISVILRSFSIGLLICLDKSKEQHVTLYCNHFKLGKETGILRNVPLSREIDKSSVFIMGSSVWL